MAPSLRLAALLSVLVLLVGCEKKYPGEPVGTFHIVGELKENTCGALAVPAENPLVFDVELRADDGLGIWRRAQKPYVSGTYRASNASFRFATEVIVTAIQPSADQLGCALAQDEIISGTVTFDDMHEDGSNGDLDGGIDEASDAGSGPAASGLTGESTIDFTPTAGSQCLPATAVAGGPFLALPCRVRYTLEGTPRGSL